MARMKSSGLFSEVRISFLVTGDGVSACDATLHLDEAQPAGAGHSALDVVAELVALAVHGDEAEGPLHLHDDGACPRRGCLGVDWLANGRRRAAHRAKQADRCDQQAAEDHGRQRGQLPLALNLLQPALQAALQVIGPLARLRGC